jgi:hypothetical protein
MASAGRAGYVLFGKRPVLRSGSQVISAVAGSLGTSWPQSVAAAAGLLAIDTTWPCLRFTQRD